MFDGNSLAGWHKYGGNPVGAAWKVADSSIHLDASSKQDWQIKGGGDIVTDGEYDNYHLKLDWKIDTNGNSGIIIFIHEDSVKYTWPWQTGPEMQVLDNAGHPDVPDVPGGGSQRLPPRPHHPLHRLQRELRGVADEGLHR